MNKFDEITKKLAQQEPELTDADALCDQIMARLPDVTIEKPTQTIETKKQAKTTLWIRRGQAISSAAAIFLIAIFVHQTYGIMPAQESSIQSASLPIMNADNTFDQIRKSTNLQEAIPLLKEIEKSKQSAAKLKKQYASMNY